MDERYEALVAAAEKVMEQIDAARASCERWSVPDAIDADALIAAGDVLRAALDGMRDMTDQANKARQA